MLTELEQWRIDTLSKRYTKEWQKIILESLEKDELIENYPSTDGLARITRLLFGEFSNRVEVVKSPTKEDRSASVVVTLFLPGAYYSGAADVYEFNTKAPYSKHPVATAETKAFGRALKKVLGLKVHTHEEMIDDEFAFEKITDQQIRAIENIAKKIEIDLEKFLSENAGISLEFLKSGNSGISKDQGLKLISKLNEVQNT